MCFKYLSKHTRNLKKLLHDSYNSVSCATTWTEVNECNNILEARVCSSLIDPYCTFRMHIAYSTTELDETAIRRCVNFFEVACVLGRCIYKLNM